MAKLDYKEKALLDVYEVKVFSAKDSRGYVVKPFDKHILETIGVTFTPYEAMIIESKKDVLRGVHFQFGFKQDKLVQCISGKVWAVVVDLRPESKTIGQWVKVNINDGMAVYVPRGCAFGTLALEDSWISCMFGCQYNAELDSGIRWDDADIDIKWPLNLIQGEAILSEKDKSLMSYRDYLKKIEVQ